MLHFFPITLIVFIILTAYNLYTDPLIYHHTITGTESTTDCFKTGGYVVVRPNQDIKCYNAPLKD